MSGKQMKRKYDEDFKSEAVQLAYEIGKKMAARQLGVSYSTICRWYKELADTIDENKVPAQPMPDFETVFGRTRDELIDLIRKLEREADEKAESSV